MSRAYCYQCRRAKVACLCGRIEKQANKISVIVLQHPDEKRNPKGSAIIAELGLRQYQCWAGEDFTEHSPLANVLLKNKDNVAVLYPDAGAFQLDKPILLDIKIIIIIDATWRKAKKIWEMNPFLRDLPCIKLSEQGQSNYRIRKIPKEGYLSSLECIVASLRVLERQPQSYQVMLDLFDQMIDFQIDNMSDMVYQKNYVDKKEA